MKKTLKAALSILLVLALLTALPLTAMAEGEGVTPPANDNSLDLPITSEDIGTNTGKITTNVHEVDTNYGNITDNGTPQTDGTKSNPDSGTVKNNQYSGQTSGQIENNYGTVVKNGSITGAPTISNNYGVVRENYGDGKVGTNQSGGVVEKNHGGGTVWNNYGQVDNNADGYVMNNKDGGEVSNNGGTVSRNEEGGIVDNKSGNVKTNYGTVIDNGGTVQNNKKEITINCEGGTVSKNWSGGTIGLNQGTVSENIGGEVTVNDIMGTVTNNIDNGGSVKTNYGTVIEKTYIPAESSSSFTTYYGVHGEDEDGNKYYYKDTAENQSGNTAFVGYQKGTEVDLDEVVSQYKRDGFKLTKYAIQVYKDGEFSDYTPNEEAVARANVDAGDGGGDGEGEAAKPLYRISAPTLLKLTWEKIASIFKPAASSGGGGGAEAVELSAKKHYIGLGSVIFINEKGYKVVEIKDDAFVVVSYDALSDEDVKDLDALFAKLFTAEQQKLIKNIGQLLDAEDVLTVFGKPGNHPVFEISKALVE